ncbi:hypothetical protein PMZ80_003802 [Knufia obscura]|uniref:CoA carboxyltransferase C-terminal domain-containing protein n=1 Tax=Knufia obscura TaxID=1635080 RepID=A0ABR0RVB4_9EURO|nr:hypothetical protein PMZ80_003802 [Knufia obscura]
MGKKIADDPVYNQPKGYSSSSNQPSQSEGIADDPVYNQPKKGSSSNNADYPSESQKPRERDGLGEVTEDPTYDQPQTKSSDSNAIADDPTYNQPKSASSGGNDNTASEPQAPRKRDGKGEVTEDPTYDQPQTGPSSSSDSKPIADDPTYNQPKGSDNDQSSEIADDPTYNQPGAKDTTNQSPSQQPPPKQDGKGEVTEDPTYNQPGATESQSQSNAQSRASTRLSQLTSQIAPSPTESEATPPTSNTSKPRKPQRKKNQDYQTLLPADHSDIMTHISTMQSHARNPPPDHRGYTRQKAAGKMTARERITTLLNPGSFREVGSITGTTKWSVDSDNPLRENVEDFIPSNNPQGFGSVTCARTGNGKKVVRQVYLTSDDFSIRGGHADGHNGLKTLYGEKLALRLKVPVVKLVDGSSGGGSVTTIQTQGYSYLPHVTILRTVMMQLNAGIPNLGAVVGPAIGLGFARVVSTHFSVMAADIGSAFNAGPKVVEGATFEEGLSFQDLGGPWVHCCNGTIDNMARDEAECYEQIRTVLGFLPSCGALEAPPCLEEGWSGDEVGREDVSLRSIISRKKNRMYDPYRIIESVVDRTSWFEIGRLWGRTGIVGLARLGGRPVAILSNNCEVNGGALDAAGSQKLMKMIKFADIFNLPIVQFVDVPGYAIGTVAERSGVMKWGVELGKAYYTSTTPIFTVLTRRAYGVAGGIMLDSREPWMRIAWPSANWGSLPLDGGIEVGHRHELKTIREQAEKEKPGSGEEAFKKKYKELDEMYVRLMNPVRTANVFNVEEIVDPKDTRKICCRWVKEMYGLVMKERLADRASGKIVPVFS